MVMFRLEHIFVVSGIDLTTVCSGDVVLSMNTFAQSFPVSDSFNRLLPFLHEQNHQNSVCLEEAVQLLSMLS